MPLKVCSVAGPDCEGEYFARWRNTPAVCTTCAQIVIVCPGCGAVKLRADDPLQLPLLVESSPGQRPLSSLVAHHFANRVPPSFDWEAYAEQLLSDRREAHHDSERAHWPRRASETERRRYPFH